MVSSELWAVDLDGTLLDTGRALDLFCDTCEDHGIARGAIDNARRDTESSGGSFDVIDHLLKEGVDEEALARITVQFVRTGRQMDLLFEDSVPFLAQLDNRGLLNLILTYGNPLWQTAKLKASGLDNRNHQAVDIKQKGQVIAEWQSESGYNAQVEGARLLVAASVILVDDKLVSFSGVNPTAVRP